MANTTGIGWRIERNVHKALQALFPVGTLLPAYAVLVITTENLIRSIQHKLHPKELREYMEVINRVKLFLQYAAISIGAILTSTPFFLTALEFPEISIDVLNDIFDGIFLIANILLHLPPIQIMIEDPNPIYRLPVLPFTGSYRSYQWIQQKRMSNKAQELLKLELKKQKSIKILKKSIHQTIEQAKQLLIRNNYRFDKSHLIYKMMIPNGFTNFDSSRSSVDQLIELIEHTNTYKKEVGTWNKWFTWGNWLAENVIYMAGGLWAIFAFSGYSADAFKELPTVEPFDDAPDWVSQTVGITSDYVFNTLFFYLTANATLRPICQHRCRFN